MNKRLLFLLILGFLMTGNLWAQWTPKDSLWLNDVLSGKDTLRLNPETMDAIKRGTLINPEMRPQTPMKEFSRELPLLIDFDEYFQSIDSVIPRKFDWTEMPPAIILRFYNPKMPREFEFMINNISNHVKETKFRGPGVMQADMVHGLNMAFSKEYRQFHKNSIKAKELKSYAGLPSPELQKKQQLYRMQHPERFVANNDSISYQKQKEALPLPLVTLRSPKDSIPVIHPDSAQIN
ncbi:DUF4858 domain-containing protein [Parabacteroides sp. OttesenSCG-928-K15]|nr:DUF4858 domain-containing protein [Parabacteroides sp. OttesenSCG-928-K15]